MEDAFYNLELLCQAAELEQRNQFIDNSGVVNDSDDGEEQGLSEDFDYVEPQSKTNPRKRAPPISERSLHSSEKRRIIQRNADAQPSVEQVNSTPSEATQKNWWFMRVLDAVNNGVPFKTTTQTSKGVSVATEDSVTASSPEDSIPIPQQKQVAVYTPIITMNWLTHLEELKQFKNEYGHCNVSRKNMQWKSLGHWVRQQRRKKKNAKLNDTQIDLLDKMGFEWDRSYYLYSKVPHKGALKELPVQLLHRRKRKTGETSEDANSSTQIPAKELTNTIEKQIEQVEAAPKKSSSVLTRITRQSAFARSL